jgi:sucrose synthase
MIVLEPWVALAVRSSPGVWDYVCINVHELGVHRLSTSEYLQLKELLGRAAGQKTAATMRPDPFTLELDFEPFNASFPRLTMPSSIGHGVDFLNRHLSSRMFRGGANSMQPLLQFLRMHKSQGQVKINTRKKKKKKKTNNNNNSRNGCNPTTKGVQWRSKRS